MKHSWLVVLLLAPLVLGYRAAGNTVPQFQSRSTASDWPVREVTDSNVGVFYGKAIRAVYIEVAPKIPTSMVVRLDIFETFRPGLTIEQTISRHGSPHDRNFDGKRSVAVYELSKARIEVVDETGGGSACATYHRRTVYAYPKHSGINCLKAAEILHPSIIAQIPAITPAEVNIARQGSREHVWLLLRNGCVEGINWFTAGSQP